MEASNNHVERLYSPGEVADHLEIERQTVTKYARLFEDNGYNFHKDDKGNRTYTDTNIMMFKDLITQRNTPGITLESAAKSLTAIYKSKSITPSDTNLHSEKERHNQVTDKNVVESLRQEITAIKEHLEKQDRFNEALIQQLQKMDSVNIDRHNQLAQLLKESQENQKLIAAARKEENEKEQEIVALREENHYIKEHLEKQDQFNQALMEQFQQLERGSKERDTQLIQSLKEGLEIQKMQAAAREEEKEKEKEQKKGLFARLFGK